MDIGAGPLQILGLFTRGDGDRGVASITEGKWIPQYDNF